MKREPPFFANFSRFFCQFEPSLAKETPEFLDTIKAGEMKSKHFQEKLRPKTLPKTHKSELLTFFFRLREGYCSRQAGFWRASGYRGGFCSHAIAYCGGRSHQASGSWRRLAPWFKKKSASPLSEPPKSRAFVGSAKTDPVQFKWGLGEELLKDKFAFFEAYKSPIPKRRNCLQNARFYKQKRALFQNTF